jgi:hypothetical protein
MQASGPCILPIFIALVAEDLVVDTAWNYLICTISTRPVHRAV